MEDDIRAVASATARWALARRPFHVTVSDRELRPSKCEADAATRDWNAESDLGACDLADEVVRLVTGDLEAAMEDGA